MFLIKLTSVLVMFTVPAYYFFPENSVLQSFMLGNEFLHWLMLIFFPMVFGALSKTFSQKQLEDDLEKETARIEKMDTSESWRYFRAFADFLAVFFLVFLLNDWSFTIVLLFSMMVSEVAHHQKKELKKLLKNFKQNAHN